MSGKRSDKGKGLRPWPFLLAAAGIHLQGGSTRSNGRQGLMQLIARRWPEVLFMHETSRLVVGLTIDDGPHPLLTPQILQVLADYQAHATFFMLSDRVRGRGDLVRQVVDGGHELGNHLCYDAASIRLAPDEFVRQLHEAHEVLSAFAPVSWFRPGSGWFNQQMLADLQQRGYRCALASVYPYDAQFPYPVLVSNYVLRNVFPGAIITLHEGAWTRRGTVRVLRTILPVLQQRGYEVLSLSELVATPPA
ncbi:MAG: polysaccharide deacetylase family protein [Chloroflexi bacterium]|nr:polysaccharide deacetylase family protein [Chloroflexota bacterium]